MRKHLGLVIGAAFCFPVLLALAQVCSPYDSRVGDGRSGVCVFRQMMERKVAPGVYDLYFDIKPDKGYWQTAQSGNPQCADGVCIGDPLYVAGQVSQPRFFFNSYAYLDSSGNQTTQSTEWLRVEVDINLGAYPNFEDCGRGGVPTFCQALGGLDTWYHSLDGTPVRCDSEACAPNTVLNLAFEITNDVTGLPKTLSDLGASTAYFVPTFPCRIVEPDHCSPYAGPIAVGR